MDELILLQVREAYKLCMSYVKNVALSHAALEDELMDIERDLGFKRPKRLAHRHYLTHDRGRGTVLERQKYSDQHRLSQAIDSVFQKKFEKALENPNDKEVGRYTGGDPWLKESSRSWITHSIERIADDQIREAMARGDFANIQGSGKPIKDTHSNVGLDHTSYQLNKMLINSGFAPEWVTLDKEVRHSICKLRERLTITWHKCGPYPMNRTETQDWEKALEDINELLNDINANVNRLNLIVPNVSMQRAHFRLEVIVNRVVLEVMPDRSLVFNQGHSVVDSKPPDQYTSSSIDAGGLDLMSLSPLGLLESIRGWYRSIADKFFK